MIVGGDASAVAFPGACVLTSDDVMRGETFPQVYGCNLFSVGEEETLHTLCITECREELSLVNVPVAFLSFSLQFIWTQC